MATTSDSWITINSGSGSGNGTVSFTVQQNTGPARTGAISVGGQTFTINQGSGCSYSLSSTSVNVPGGGSNGNFNVSVGAGCTWQATTDVAWVTIINGSGVGNGTVTYTVAANSGPNRTGTITVNGQTSTINQASGCTYSLSQNSTTFGASGGVGSFNITANSACSWTATTSDSWLTINSGSGSGNGAVTFTVQP